MVQEISNSLKFIHASDLHFGKHQYQCSERANDNLLAFEELLSQAISNEVDFIILGGDIFNSMDLLPTILSKLLQILEKFKKTTKGLIPIIAIDGNHDLRSYYKHKKMSQDQSWLHFLAEQDLLIYLNTSGTKDKFDEQFNFKGYSKLDRTGNLIQIKFAEIYGIGYLGRKTETLLSKINDAILPDPAKFHILIAHLGVSGQMKNVPGVPYNLLKPFKSKINYFALGHYHKGFQLENWIFNPGSLEANGSIESTFPRGIYLVEVYHTPNIFQKRVKWIKIKNRKFVWEEIYLNKGINSEAQLLEEIQSQLISQISDIKINNSPENERNRNNPVLCLKLRGYLKEKLQNFDESNLKRYLINHNPIIDVNLWNKTTSNTTTLEHFVEVSRKKRVTNDYPVELHN